MSVEQFTCPHCCVGALAHTPVCLLRLSLYASGKSTTLLNCSAMGKQFRTSDLQGQHIQGKFAPQLTGNRNAAIAMFAQQKMKCMKMVIRSCLGNSTLGLCCNKEQLSYFQLFGNGDVQFTSYSTKQIL